MTLPPLGLYIHLPWCERKCPYCDFNSHTVETIPEAHYIDHLLLDLESDAALSQGREVSTIFIGGGTPSLFSAGGIKRLLQHVANVVPVAAGVEITMEANPGSAEAEKFLGFAAAGVNRLSLGVQSFNDQCLAALGRVHSGEQALNAIEYALAAGFNSFNLDLMHGLPDQTAAMAQADLETALTYSPQHLSWYQLTIETNTAFYKRPPTLPVEDELADIQEAGERLLAAAGYEQYEVSAYSRPDFQCRHNVNYWQFGDYLGIGAGAHGKISDSNGGVTRYSKTRKPEDYLNAVPGKLTASKTPLAPAELPGEYMLNALRLSRGFSMDDFHQRTGLPGEVLLPRIENLEEKGLLELSAGQVRATPLGRRFLDSVLLEFLD